MKLALGELIEFQSQTGLSVHGLKGIPSLKPHARAGPASRAGLDRARDITPGLRPQQGEFRFSDGDLDGMHVPDKQRLRTPSGLA